MPVDENHYQLLGFMELNGPEAWEMAGKQYGKSPTCIELKRPTDLNNRDTIKLP
jgi:hypothetical protein